MCHKEKYSKLRLTTIPFVRPVRAFGRPVATHRHWNALAVVETRELNSIVAVQSYKLKLSTSVLFAFIVLLSAMATNHNLLRLCR